jgi:hypothetical protein
MRDRTQFGQGRAQSSFRNVHLWSVKDIIRQAYDKTAPNLGCLERKKKVLNPLLVVISK